MNAPITVGIEDVAEEGFIVDDESKAAWAVSVIRARRRHLADLEEQHAVRMAKAERELKRAEQFLGPQLEQWARAELKKPAARGARHVDVATGRLQFRRREGGIRIDNDAAVLDFVRKHEESMPGAIVREMKERLDKERVKIGLAVLFTKKMVEALQGTALTPAVPIADLASANLAAAAAKQFAIAALPPGVVYEEDMETFSIVGGGDR